MIEDLHKQWEERFQNQEKKFQAMMAEMQEKYQNAASGSSYASQPTPLHYSPRHYTHPPPTQPQANVVDLINFDRPPQQVQVI